MADGPDLPEITDEYMQEHLARSREYTLVLLRPGAQYQRDDREPIVWEHGRRNFALRADGRLSIVGPVTDDSDLSGMYIFATTPDEARTILDGDPAVRAEIFAYEVHPVRSFPGDALA